MARTLVRWWLSCALSLLAAAAAGETLCSTAPVTYPGAEEEYQDLRFALATILDRGVATWLSDRIVNGNATATAEELVASCDEDTRLSVVLYALPNKDCSAGYSNGNASVVTGADYAEFVEGIAAIIGERKVLYVVEPDAVGLIVDGGCAIESGYQSNITAAVEILSTNPNAEIYIDVGYWTLASNESAARVAEVIKDIAKNGTVKGITLNTSNYRPTGELVELCSNFQAAINSTDMHCILDTARNYDGYFNSTEIADTTEWCNSRLGGVGHPPTDDTGYDNIDYFLYIKPLGESDGYCTNQTDDAMRGPEAGTFFYEHFVKLWNHGYLTNTDDFIKIYDATEDISAAATAGKAARTLALAVLVTALVALI
jgi:cellulase/cellobiase CelA1